MKRKKYNDIIKEVKELLKDDDMRAEFKRDFERMITPKAVCKKCGSRFIEVERKLQFDSMNHVLITLCHDCGHIEKEVLI